MSLADELREIVDVIVRSRWDQRDGRVVPETSDIGLGNIGVELEVTMLYADLADSTSLAMNSRTLAAETYKAFLACSTKIILARGGSIRSFDGDRVMGVFVGDSKNTSAIKAGLQIKWAMDEIIRPRFEKQYEAFRNGTLTLSHGSGIDLSKVLVARAGVRDNNDLVWVGRAPNIAAKLSTLRESPYCTYITKDVYDRCKPEVKVTNGKAMWEERSWKSLPTECQTVYRSSWRWPV